ncbi:pyridoxamine 5'-phosphate oxidase family protein [Paracoccus caeni]|uniref:nitric oxide dioxygenase n=1 Tax=Paracoccus caeni TaxID=657651 RepID=A0A934W0D1_9RHOB|nr:pyridoxamine 5'-phosphate oxidase family protein [Paracoccus caeni]MBK4216810.1 pyridoxamine 5'-phosphate oxidase family protein [Paracoccus caeni]
MTIHPSPFHSGEVEAQRLAEVGDVASWAGGFIRDHMPDQHREFFTALPFMIMTGGDTDGWPWVTILEGGEGFIRSPDPQHLMVAASLSAHDPLAGALTSGASVGMLGIEMSTRRRNRMNGLVTSSEAGLRIEVRQSFGNCPQYIHERAWQRVTREAEQQPSMSDRLTIDQQAQIAAADTFFIGSGSMSDGYDASHRGGPRGFVHISPDGRRLRIPDYAGNNYFNTIGNLLRDPRAGLLFVDFETGGLLHVAGRATIDWQPTDSHDPNARRMIEIEISRVIDRPAALALRWRDGSADLRKVRVVAKVPESNRITSFHLEAADGKALPPFKAGQHLPIELQVPGQPERVGRSYSLSGAPDTNSYRISVKHEDHGIGSGFLHQHVSIGDTFDIHPPSGDFVVPEGDTPLVLISAGVGITPMISIMHEEAARKGARPILFAHVARDGENHAFRAELEALMAASPNIRRLMFYTKPRDTDVHAVDYDRIGRLSADDIIAAERTNGAQYLLCGPGRFLAEMRDGLEGNGVPQDRIHFETFGPGG